MIITSDAAPTQTNDAEFRAWGSTISSGLTSVGMIKTSDTGQINWTSVARPTTASESMGYEIWRFNDTLQPSAPIFFKIEYGSASGGAGRPAIWLTVGTGSNGSGTITVPSGSLYRLQSWNAAATSASTYKCYFVAGEGRLNVIMFSPLTTGGTHELRGFAIERAKGANNANNGEYFTAIMHNAPSQQITIPSAGSAIGWETQLLGRGNPSTSVALAQSPDQKQPVSEIRPYLGGWGKPLTCMVGVDALNPYTSHLMEVPINVCGSTYTYKFLKGLQQGTDGAMSMNGLAVRWE